MKYTDIKVGQKVLSNWRRTSSPKFRIEDSHEAEVLAVGVDHRYQVTSGGWDQRHEIRDTDQGVRVRRADGTELVTLAAFLIPMEGKVLDIWQAGQDLKNERLAAQAASSTQREALVRRFAEFGFEVLANPGGSIEIASADVPRLIERLEAP